MNLIKRYLPFFGVFVLVLFLIPLFLLQQVLKRGNTSISSFPTPTPVEINSLQKSISPSPTPMGGTDGNPVAKLYVVSVYPTNNTSQAPTNQQILMTFNTTFNLKDVSFNISPNFDYSLTQEKNSIRIIPKQPLLTSTTYTYSVNIADDYPSPTYTFTTLGPTPTGEPDTSIDAQSQENTYDQQNNPDVYLVNQTPYSNSYFSMVSDYSPDTGHFFFPTTLIGPDKNADKQSVNSWLKSIGITDQQILQLDIRYE